MDKEVEDLQPVDNEGKHGKLQHIMHQRKPPRCKQTNR